MQVIHAHEFMLALGDYFAKAAQHGLIIVLPEGEVLQLTQAQTLPPEIAQQVRQLQALNSGIGNYSLLGDEVDLLPDEIALAQLGLAQYASLLNADNELLD